VVSGVLDGDPLDELELRQHDRRLHDQGAALVPRRVAELDLDVARDQLLRLDVTRDQQPRLGGQHVQVAEGLQMVPEVNVELLISCENIVFFLRTNGVTIYL
jgi:hypothetical protein